MSKGLFSSLFCLTHLCRVEFSTFTLNIAGPFPIQGVSGYILLIPCFIECPLFNANREDPDQTPRSAASDLGLHCQCPFYGTLGLNGLTFTNIRVNSADDKFSEYIYSYFPQKAVYGIPCKFAPLLTIGMK